MKISKVSIALPALILVIAFAGLIAAESNQTGDNNSSLINNTSTNHTGDWNFRCQAVNHRVEGRLNMYDEARDPHLSAFSHVTNLIERVINRTYAQGYNTTALEDDLVTLNGKIAKFQVDYDLFIQKLNETRNFTCGHSEGRFVAALNDSRAQLRIVRADAEDIKDFIKNTIKKDIADLRDQRQDMIEKLRGERRNITSQIMDRIRNRTGAGFNGTGRNLTNPMMNRTPGREFNGTGRNLTNPMINRTSGGES